MTNPEPACAPSPMPQPECPSPLKGQIVAGIFVLIAPALIYAYDSGRDEGRLNAIEHRQMELEARLPPTFPPPDTEKRINRLEHSLESLTTEWRKTVKEIEADIKALQVRGSDAYPQR